MAKEYKFVVLRGRGLTVVIHATFVPPQELWDMLGYKGVYEIQGAGPFIGYTRHYELKVNSVDAVSTVATEALIWLQDYTADR